MTIIKKSVHSIEKRTINLDGPDGNAFCLLGYAQTFADQLNYDADAILSEMQGGDYVHLVKTFELHFGYLINLETRQEKLIESLTNAPQHLPIDLKK
jgi:hypothetical protein